MLHTKKVNKSDFFSCIIDKRVPKEYLLTSSEVYLMVPKICARVHYVALISQHPNTHRQHGVHCPIVFAFTFIFCSIVSATQTNFLRKMFVQSPVECVTRVVTTQLE